MNYSKINYDDKITIEGEDITINDLIKNYKKSNKLKKNLNKSALSYYHRNSDKILKRMRSTYGENRHVCVCGANVINKIQHSKSKKHQNFLQKHQQDNPNRYNHQEEEKEEKKEDEEDEEKKEEQD